MMFLALIVAAVAALITTGLGFIGSIIEGFLNSEAMTDVAKINTEAAKQMQQLQIDLARESRGENGTPTWLPRYTGDYEANTLFPGAKGTYDTAMSYLGTPDKQVAFNKGVLDSWQKAIGDSSGIVKSLYSGQHTAEQLANQQPVNQARLAAAGSVRQATNLNIQNRINQMKAQQANRGFVGGSTFDQSAILREAAPMYNQAAGAETAARLQNATDEQGIKQNNWLMAYQNPNLPNQMAAQDMAAQSLPALQAVQDQLTALGVFAPFNMGNWTPPTLQKPYEVQPNTAWGNAASKAGTQADNWLNNLWSANQTNAAATEASSEAQKNRDWMQQMQQNWFDNSNTNNSSSNSSDQDLEDAALAYFYGGGY